MTRIFPMADRTYVARFAIDAVDDDQELTLVDWEFKGQNKWMTSRLLRPFSKWNEISKELLMKKRTDMQGEGNYDAAFNFNDSQQKFVESGRLAEASKRTKPKSKEEANELARAENQGRSRAKGSDPAAYRSGRKASRYSEEEPL